MILSFDKTPTSISGREDFSSGGVESPSEAPMFCLSRTSSLGYGLEDYPGKGPIEASGGGFELEVGDVAFRYILHIKNVIHA
ncbi:MAG: hypothetical protein FH761_05410 [Firmicutes bacterium]|nr:hypothetical protein [Bacillota bacterium]